MNVQLGDRSGFPDLEVEAYLNHAAISPPSGALRRAVDGLLDAYARKGVGAFGRALEQRSRLRAMLARLIGATAEDLAFVANTTRGVTDVALCFPWSAGDRVVLSRGEFPANVTPWQRAAEVFGLELVWLPQPTPQDFEEQWWPAFLEAIEGGAAIVAVSAVQFQTGFRMPLARIGETCRDGGAQLFVDAIQACGVVPIDVEADRIDYLSCGSHKWLMGPEGLAMLYVAPERVAALRPRVAGWLSHESALSFLFEGPGRLRYDRPIRARADFVEGGISNAMGCAALEAALTPLLELGTAAIFEHVDAYLDRLEAPLLDRGFESLRAPSRAARSGILSLRPPAGVDVVALHGALDPQAVSCAIPDGLLRFAPHYPNHPREIPGVLAAIDEALARAG